MNTTQKPSQSLSATDTRLLVEYLAAQGDLVAFAKAANLKLQDALQWAFSPQITLTLKQLHEMQNIEFLAAAAAAKRTCIEVLSTTMAQIVEFHEKNKDDPALRSKSNARFGTLLRALSLLARVSGFKLTTPAAAARVKTSEPSTLSNSKQSGQLPTQNTTTLAAAPSNGPAINHSDPLPFITRESSPPVTQLFNACGGARAIPSTSVSGVATYTKASSTQSIPKSNGRSHRVT